VIAASRRLAPHRASPDPPCFQLGLSFDLARRLRDGDRPVSPRGTGHVSSSAGSTSFARDESIPRVSRARHSEGQSLSKKTSEDAGLQVLKRMKGLETSTFCMAKGGGRSRQFAHVHRNLTFAASSSAAIEPDRTRANVECSHCSYCDSCHDQRVGRRQPARALPSPDTDKERARPPALRRCWLTV
jgi:hypothetical protein